MRYGLIQLKLGDNNLKQIPKEQFESIVSARSNIFSLLQMEEKFVFLIDNFRELEIDAISSTMQNANMPSLPWSEKITTIHLFNRRILNLLTTCRVYLDHTPHHLSEVVPSDNTIKKSHKEKLARHYDSVFSYRFLEALRNYAQHRGLPLSGVMHMNQNIEQIGSQHTLEFNINPEDLIDDPKFKTKISDELKTMDNRIDIRPMIREYVSKLADAHQYLRESLHEKFEESKSIVEEAIQSYAGDNKKLELGLHIVAEDEDRTITKKTFLDRNPAERYVEIKGKYSNLSAIHRQYITSGKTQPN